MKRKMLPKKDAPSGLYLYCSKHKSWYKNDNVVKCKCELKYKAKVHVPGTKNNSRIKTFVADDVESAIQIFEEFKKELKSSDYHLVVVKEKEEKPIYLLDCIAEFIDFKKDINVPFHNRNNLPAKTIREIENCLEYFVYALVDKGIKPEILRFEVLDGNELIAGHISEFLLQKKGLKNKTYNNKLSTMKSFVNYTIRKHYPYVSSPFSEVKYKKVVYKPKAISISNFNALIELILPENSIDYKEVKRKINKGYTIQKKKINYYRDWLIEAYYIGLFTGGRKEETTQMKWSDIQYNSEGKISHIVVTDLKVNRKEKREAEEDNLIEKYVEMTPEFEDLLFKMGFEEKRDSDEYILANEESLTRQYMADFISKSFFHFYKQLGLNDGLSFKHLRKTYVTQKYIENEDNVTSKTGHAGVDVVLKHYVDMKMVMEAKRKKNFGEE